LEVIDALTLTEIDEFELLTGIDGIIVIFDDDID